MGYNALFNVNLSFKFAFNITYSLVAFFFLLNCSEIIKNIIKVDQLGETQNKVFFCHLKKNI